MTDRATRRPVVVIGVGNVMRGDDGVGPVAVELLDHEGFVGAETLVLDGESTRLLDAWSSRRRAIVIDAIRLGDPAGTVHELEVGRDLLPAWTAETSSHETGLAEAVELSRALDRLPDRLLVFGIEPGDVSPGPGLSPEVEAALPELVARVRKALTP